MYTYILLLFLLFFFLIFCYFLTHSFATVQVSRRRNAAPLQMGQSLRKLQRQLAQVHTVPRVSKWVTNGFYFWWNHFVPPYDHGIHLAVTKSNNAMLATFETRLFHLIQQFNWKRKKFKWQRKMQKYKDALKIQSNFGKISSMNIFCKSDHVSMHFRITISSVIKETIVPGQLL